MPSRTEWCQQPQDYNEARLERTSMFDECFAADLDQNYGTGPAPGPGIPTLVRHGMIRSWGKDRHAVPKEHLLMQGIPVYPEVGATDDALHSIKFHLHTHHLLPNAVAQCMFFCSR